MPTPGQVYLRRVVHGAPPALWAEAVGAVLEASNVLRFIRRRDLIAIKLHVGEPGLKTFLPPAVAGELASRVRSHGGRPFLTDSAVLYAGPRNNGVEHTEVAHRHGFTFEQVGAPFLPADGIQGNLEQAVAIEGTHFREVGIAQAIADADGLVLLSHATGHLVSGFGATLKNLGMGCSSRKGKLLQHSDTKPRIRAKKCEACGACVEACPEDAIRQETDGTAVIDDGICIGCGECIAHCRSDAVGFQWDSASAKLQEKMAEHALGVMKSTRGKLACVVGLVNLTRDCDCISPGAALIARDIGFAASLDPVALDQAVLDLVEAQEGKTLNALAYPRLDGTVQLSYAEQLGLGSRSYRLVEV